MKKLMTVALLLAAVGTAKLEAQATKFTVAGIPVIFKPVTANEVVAVRLYLKGGAASLTPQNAGIESMMFAAATQGTSKYTKDAFSSLSTETGTNIGSESTM